MKRKWFPIKNNVSKFLKRCFVLTCDENGALVDLHPWTSESLVDLDGEVKQRHHAETFHTIRGQPPHKGAERLLKHPQEDHLGKGGAMAEEAKE